MPVSTLQDVYLLQTLSGLVGGAGGWLFHVSSPDESNDTDHKSIWLLDRRGRTHRLTESANSASGAAWSSASDKIGFIRSTETTPQLFSLSLEGGEASQLGAWDDGLVSIEHWDGDVGRALVLAHSGTKPRLSPFSVESLPYKLDGVGYKGEQRTFLYLLDESSREFTPVVAEGGDVVEAKWAPDRSTIAYVQRRDGRQRHAMDLWVKRGHEAPRRLTEDLVSIGGITWSADGQHLAFSGSSVEGSSMSWLMEIEVATGQRQEYAVEVAMPGPIQWADGGNELLFLEAFRGNHRISKISRVAPFRVVPVVERVDAQVLDMAAVGDAIAYIEAGPNRGPELWLYQQSTGDSQRVSSFNRWRDQRPAMHAERRSFYVPDGEGGTESVDGWLLSPSGYGPFPLLLDMHGGPHSLVTFEHETHAHWPVLVEQGWAILALNPVGTNSYGETFASRLCGRWGELDLPQWLSAVDILRKQGVADERLAVFGHSYGGFLSAWALTRNIPLVCGVVSAGVLNMESHTGTSDTGYYVGPYAMAGEPDEQRERYNALSPLSHAASVTAPTLLLQGDADQRCPLGQAEEFFSRLIRHGKTQPRLVVFPDGTHHVSSTGKPSHRVAFYRHLVEWLRKHVGRSSAYPVGDSANQEAWTPTDDCRTSSAAGGN